MDTFRIIMYIIITIVIVLLVYTKMHNDIKTQIIKINSAESKIDESLRQKYDLLVKAIAEILQIDKDNKDFKNIDTIKNEELSSFEFERKTGRTKEGCIWQCKSKAGWGTGKTWETVPSERVLSKWTGSMFFRKTGFAYDTQEWGCNKSNWYEYRISDDFSETGRTSSRASTNSINWGNERKKNPWKITRKSFWTI